MLPVVYRQKLKFDFSRKMKSKLDPICDLRCCLSKHNSQPKCERICQETKAVCSAIQDKHTHIQSDLYSKDMEECGVFPLCVHSGTFCLLWL